jgi:hypothetical protein
MIVPVRSMVDGRGLEGGDLVALVVDLAPGQDVAGVAIRGAIRPVDASNAVRQRMGSLL